MGVCGPVSCAFFPDLHLPGFVQRQISGRDSFERSSFALSYRTPPLLTCSGYVGLPHFHVAFPRQGEEELPVITYPDHETNPSAFFPPQELCSDS